MCLTREADTHTHTHANSVWVFDTKADGNILNHSDEIFIPFFIPDEFLILFIFCVYSPSYILNASGVDDESSNASIKINK